MKMLAWALGFPVWALCFSLATNAQSKTATKSTKGRVAALRARELANAERMRMAGVREFAKHPEQALLSDAFSAAAHQALETIKQMVPLVEGVQYGDEAQAQAGVLLNTWKTTGELIVSLNMENLYLMRFKHAYSAAPVGALPEISAREAEQEAQCIGGITLALDAGKSPPSIPECGLYNFPAR